MLTKSDLSGIKKIVQQAVKKETGPLSTDVSTLKTDVSSLKTDVSTLKTDVSSLNRNVFHIQKDVRKIRSDIGVTIKFFDRSTLNHEKRIQRVESHLHFQPIART